MTSSSPGNLFGMESSPSSGGGARGAAAQQAQQGGAQNEGLWPYVDHQLAITQLLSQGILHQGNPSMAPLVGQQINSLIPPGAAAAAAAAAAANQQQPSLNMMIQGSQGLIHSHALQSPPNSANLAQYLLVGHPRVEGGPRDMNPSPNSTPSGGGNGMPPPPSATPPSVSMDIADRNWAAANQNLFLGDPRLLGPGEKNIEEQLKQQLGDFIPMAQMEGFAANLAAAQDRGNGGGSATAGLHQQHTAAALQDMNRLNPYNHYAQSVPPPAQAQSPPISNVMQAMPPRPRPEGGQDPSPNFPPVEQQIYKINKKEDLVIGSWEEDCSEKQQQQQHSNQQPMNVLPPHYTQQQHFLMQQKMLEDSKFEESRNFHHGWGAPSSGTGWGSGTPLPPPIPPPPHHPPHHHGPPHHSSQQSQGMPHKQHQPSLPNHPVNSWQQRSLSKDPVRGNYRGRGGKGTRGGGGNVPPGPLSAGTPSDHSQEKKDGKKSAIAETIAMMTKMKMEEKERQINVKPMNPSSEGDDADCEVAGKSNGVAPRASNFKYRGNTRGGSRGGFRGKGRGGINSHITNNSGLLGNNVPSEVFTPPPFRGVDFYPFNQGGFPGSYPMSSFYRPPLMPPLMPGGGGRGYHPRGGGAGLFRGPPPPPQMVGFPPRPYYPNFPYGNNQGGIRRGSNRGGRGRGGINSYENKKYIKPQRSNPSPTQDEMIENEGDNDEVTIPPSEVNPSESSNDENGEDTINNEKQSSTENASGEDEAKPEAQPPKNLISGQGNPKGQLALSARRRSSIEDLDLRGRLIRQLVGSLLECMICLSKVRPKNEIWSCLACYQLFHLRCIKKWSKSMIVEEVGWRCPGCQNITNILPKEYRCFCGKLKDPEVNYYLPHSCGDVCGNERKSCSHKCIEQCHPGPCPPCPASTEKTCPCGKTCKRLKCSANIDCMETCEKILNCGKHYCQKSCHLENCSNCEEQIIQNCHCGQASRSITCSEYEDSSTKYSCETLCGNDLSCGHHACQDLCHSGDCRLCPLSPEVLKTCPCGSRSLENRSSCLDEVPLCEKECSKPLKCGHLCLQTCHLNDCPICPLSSTVKCVCGSGEKEVPCAEMTMDEPVQCNKKCTKKRTCGRHKCNQPCCTETRHVCPLVCSKQLSCGLHRCEEQCHAGFCPPCIHASFEELHCFCGEEVIYPPIPCGTLPPTCKKPCKRSMLCGHEAMHDCHVSDECPLCVVLTDKWCYGKHELRQSVPCHVEGISCGKPCGKPLPCGRHDCIRICHFGDCKEGSQKCNQPCKKSREETCGHSCNAPCHNGDCPKTFCREKIQISCSCGLLTSTVLCTDNEREFCKIRTSQLASRLSSGDSVDISVLSAKDRKLECDKECSRVERNKHLALALQIENPDINSKLNSPKYTDFLKSLCKKDGGFVQNVHDRLVDLVKLAKSSKKSRQYSFDYMNKEKRQFIHDYSDFFGVTSESFDPEPKRNVVVTAFKDKCWLPSQSIVDVVNGLKRPPGPVCLRSSSTKVASVTVPLHKSSSLTSMRPSMEPNKPEEPIIDYFDMDQ